MCVCVCVCGGGYSLRDLSLFIGGGGYWGEGHYIWGEGHYFFSATLGRVSNDFYNKFLILKLMFALSRDVRTTVLT